MQTRALLLCVLATLALAQADTVICNIDVVITGADTSGYEHCATVLSVTIMNNALIHTINFPTISVVMGDVKIENNPNLETIPWPIYDVWGSVSIQNNAYLSGLPSTLMLVDGGINIGNNNQLYTASLTWLLTDRALNVHDNSHLRVLEAPRLTSTQYGLAITNNPLLTTLNFPQLTFTDTVHVQDTGLTQLNLPALTQVENQIYVQDNPLLQYVEMPNLVTVSGSVYIMGNYNGHTMSQFDFLALQYFNSWSSQPVYSFTSCNSILQQYFGAHCPTSSAQAVAAKPAMYPAIEEKKKTKKDFFEAKLKLAAKANTPAPKANTPAPK